MKKLNYYIKRTIWTLGVTLASTYMYAQETDVTEAAPDEFDPSNIINWFSLSNIFWTLVILLSTYFILRFIKSVVNTLSERSTRSRMSHKGLLPVINIIGWTFAIYTIIAGVFQPKMSTLVAMGASLGLATGLALQDMLKNVIAGIIVLVDQPFKVGDKINLANYYGEVINIGLRSTRIVTPDDSVVSIPNAEVMTNAVSNANSGEANCQVVTEIFLPMDADTRRVRELALEAARSSKFIFINKPIVILFEHVSMEHRVLLKMKVKAYVADIRNEFPFKSDITELTIKALLEEDVIEPSFFNL